MTFARQTFTCPRVDLDRLTGRFPRWAERKLVPKVLVANQTSVLEAVADRDGAWLPGVPVNTVTPTDGSDDRRGDRGSDHVAGRLRAGVATRWRDRAVDEVGAGRPVAARSAAMAGR